ncbi:hypothetical protein TUBRATIS_16590 [Tubulinosema ratisbonensis]|uniref:Uncharacterized protein n=1 Tax=Tubulinosema ratisbonensis TaxID=291195 RepID=A0A437ALB0_9MICR|nr:hypothetical protein TUBRATIS_16590 [Tubulinosema ratisbonensis]
MSQRHIVLFIHTLHIKRDTKTSFYKFRSIVLHYKKYGSGVFISIIIINYLDLFYNHGKSGYFFTISPYYTISNFFYNYKAKKLIKFILFIF